MTQNPSTSHRLAFLALLDVCRLWLGTRTTGALVDTRLDWSLFERLAFVHNLEPLLHHTSVERKLPRDDIPAALCEKWEKAYFENFVFNTRALELIQPFCDDCERLKLPIALIKGPVISARVFADPGLRIMVDLDVLGREQDLPELVRLARTAGFTGGEETAVYHLSLRHPELGLLLELHFKMYEFLPAAGSLLGELLALAEPCRQGEDFVFPALPAHLESAVEIAHLINHDLRVNLKPWFDLAAGLRTLGSEAPLRQTLEHWDLAPEAAIIGRVLERLFAIESVLRPETAPPYAQKIVDEVASEIEIVETRDRPALEEFASRPGLGAKLGYLWRLLAPPGERLEAVSGATGGRASARLEHLSRTVRRGWGNLTHGGFASAGSTSIKRQLFRRRARR